MNKELKVWENIHLTCFITILDNQIIWLQYRILHNILGTKALLHQIKKVGNNLCHFCNNTPETLIHVFAGCQYSAEIWVALKHWINQETGSAFDNDKKSLLLGFWGRGDIAFSLNAIILVARSYIFKCLKREF